MFKSIALAAATVLTASVAGAATMIFENDFDAMEGYGLVYNGGGGPAWQTGYSVPKGVLFSSQTGTRFDDPSSRMQVENGRLVFSGIDGTGMYVQNMYHHFFAYGQEHLAGGYQVKFDVSSSGPVTGDDMIRAWWSTDTSKYFSTTGPTDAAGNGGGHKAVWRGDEDATTIDMLLPAGDPHYYLTMVIAGSAMGAGQELYVDNYSVFRMEPDEFDAAVAARAADAEIVPLPSSALLLLGGLGGLALMRRFR